MFTYDLLIGLPHTNFHQLAEHLMLMHLGHFQWQSIARSIGSPLSALRTVDGGEVYATFYYIEERIPETAPLYGFKLDDTLRVFVTLRAFRNIAFDGRLVFHHASYFEEHAIHTDEELVRVYSARSCPSIHFANVFVTPHGGNAALKLAPPANASFEGIPSLPNHENAYNITRLVEQSGTFGNFDAQWACLNPDRPFVMTYAINPDRDSNGAGLVYFANYLAFLDAAERGAVEQYGASRWSASSLRTRTLRFRQLAYFGNADLDDTIRISIHVYHHTADARLMGFRYAIIRERDAMRICISEAIKAVVPG
jgi:probable biosynthetic protein (TIGR04098 family)